MKWISVNNKKPSSEINMTGNGSIYFSLPICVKRGNRMWRAIYQVEKKKFFTWPRKYNGNSPLDITDNVKEWMYENDFINLKKIK